MPVNCKRSYLIYYKIFEDFFGSGSMGTTPTIKEPWLRIHNNHETSTCTGQSIHCPPPLPHLKVEKVDGALMVAGVEVGNSCQCALPAFGCLFLVIGTFLTVITYQSDIQYDLTKPSKERDQPRILGPVCIAVAFLMFLGGCVLCVLTRRARHKEERIAFHCPLHGDFYPLSPISLSSVRRNSPSFCCVTQPDRDLLINIPPQCPRSTVPSTRSSFSSSCQLSPCPTPQPFVVPTNLLSGLGPGITTPSDIVFGSIRSLSVSHDVACFPHSRTPSPINRAPSPIPILDTLTNKLEVLRVHPTPIIVAPLPEITLVAPAVVEDEPRTLGKPKKSVSIVLPDNEIG